MTMDPKPHGELRWTRMKMVTASGLEEDNHIIDLIVKYMNEDAIASIRQDR